MRTTSLRRPRPHFARRLWWLGAVLLAALLGGAQGGNAAFTTTFSDVTTSAGINYVGQSWGAAWGDLNGDGRPDLWASNHASLQSLYVNNGDGTFTNVGSAQPVPAADDTHGQAWADFDNDGDQDLVQLTGNGTDPSDANHLLVNQGGTFVDRASALGVSYALGAGRAPLWLDVDRDGLLDLLLATHQRGGSTADLPTALFRQTASGFVNVTRDIGLDVPGTTHFAELGDLTGDGVLDLIVQNGGYKFPTRVYDLTTRPLTDRRAALGLPIVKPARDAVIADLNGDLKNDLLIVGGEVPTDVAVDGDLITARLQPPPGKEYGLAMTTPGDLSMVIKPKFHAREIGLNRIFIGAGGRHPTKFDFKVSAADSSAQGIAPHNPGDKGIWVGYDRTAGRWTFLFGNPSGFYLNFEITGSEPFGDVTPIGFSVNVAGAPDRLFIREASMFADRTSAAGLGAASFDINVVAADFDNDMDLDLYMVRTSAVKNLPNRLYENNGAGVFTVVPGAGGAEGATVGHGDVVAVADYDVDGFLDLFLTNGRKVTGGPNQLYRNQTNTNHWLEVDLVGTASNRDGIGARVVLTAGGVQQLREATGGSHERGAQNAKRLHFGLAGNMTANLRISWPSGRVQDVSVANVDRLLEIREPTT
jgi:hypothetical protein